MQLDKSKIKQSFASASHTYDSVAALQRRVANELLDFTSPLPSSVLLDLGCGTGFLTNELLGLAQSVIALDIALPMLHVTRSKLGDKARSLCADAEQLPLVEHSVEGIFSNLALQWCINLVAVFTDIKRVLKPGGKLVFSTFGPKTLEELKAAWANVDDYEHVNDFYSEQQLSSFLKQAGYTEITIETRIHLSSYDSVLALMRELKYIGAHNVIEGRNKNITSKSQMRSMIAAYEPHRSGDLVYATFEVIMISAS